MSDHSHFLNLFKRGRYCRHARPSDDEPGSSGRQEIERFTAAAIAFCFTHDPEFRQHFWERICRLESDVRSPEFLSIEVEPFQWADLLVRSGSPKGRTVHVIECKVGIGLAPHQNPLEREFEVEGRGYGSQFAKFEGAKASHRYIVLGLRSPLGLPASHPRLPLGLAQKSWRDLEYSKDKSPTPLVRDLFNSLGALGVGNFHMIKTQHLHVSSGLESIASAFSILEDLLRHLGVDAAIKNIRAWKHDDGGSELGTFVRSTGGSGLEAKLRKLTLSSDYLLWIGYLSKIARPLERSVWIYCETAARANWVEAQLVSTFKTATIQGDDHYFCVVITEKTGEGLSDLRWFENVIQTVAALPPPPKRQKT